MKYLRADSVYHSKNSFQRLIKLNIGINGGKIQTFKR
jgi:hypothetical protein